jgi:hypothetical protein
LPVPGQEFGNTPRRVVGDAGKYVGKVVLRVESVELGAFDQRVDRRGAAAAGIGTGASPPLDDIALTLVIRLLCIASNTPW